VPPLPSRARRPQPPLPLALHGVRLRRMEMSEQRIVEVIARRLHDLDGGDDDWMELVKMFSKQNQRSYHEGANSILAALRDAGFDVRPVSDEAIETIADALVDADGDAVLCRSCRWCGAQVTSGVDELEDRAEFVL